MAFTLGMTPASAVTKLNELEAAIWEGAGGEFLDRPWVSVRDPQFAGGAVGDGVTDDTAAFQAAADEGGRILIPRGTYIIDYVVLTANCIWQGEGIKTVLKKKNNSVATASNVRSYMFNVDSYDLSLLFTDVMFHGNIAGQGSNYIGQTIDNGGLITNYSGNSIGVLASGGFITNLTATQPAASTSRLIVKVINCKLHQPLGIGIYIAGKVDVNNYVELVLQGNEFHQAGASIIEYHNGSSAYDGIVYPASGYSNYLSGLTAAHVYIVDNVKALISGNSFVETRDPLAGTITPGYDWNMYNLPASGVVCTISSPEGIEDTTLEWSSLVITENTFIGMGRTSYTGNGIGVIDLYARAGDARICNNHFRKSYCAPIRGKTNARNMTITGNIIDTVVNELGINIGPASQNGQQGYYTITGNVIRNACAGVMVTGTAAPLENSNPSVDDDVNNAVDSVVIANNIVDNIASMTSTNPAFYPGLSGYGWGIQVRSAIGVTITGNVVSNLTGTGYDQLQHGILSRDGVGNLVISNNAVSNISRAGIAATGHNGPVTVSGNQVENTGYFGIQVGPIGRSVVIGNTVKNAKATGILSGASGTTGATVTGNTVLGVTDAISGSVFGIDSGARNAGYTILANNSIQDVTNTGTGTGYGSRLQYATLSDANTATIQGNSYHNIQGSPIFFQGVSATVIGNTFKSCNTSASTSHGNVALHNGTANIGTVRYVGNMIDVGAIPFATSGSASGDNMRANGKIHEQDNSWNNKQVRLAAIPVVGTWAVGDVVWNTLPAPGGVLCWVCTTAGTPGTWKTVVIGA